MSIPADSPTTFSLLRSADDIPQCIAVDKQFVNACLVQSELITTLTGTGADITNTSDTITIVDIIGNLCGNRPIRLGTNFCVDLEPGFCSSVIQNVNDAWGIYRAPGMTEITVGTGGNGVAPGANFPDVASALGDPAIPSDCNFIRITSDVTDGALTLRPNTLIYVDPGVNWTVTGSITISGDFVLMGANPTPSSQVTYGGNNQPFITGGAGSSLFVQNLHLIHAPQLGNGEIFVSPNIPTRMSHVVVDVGISVEGFLSDSTAAFVNMTLDHVTLQGSVGPDIPAAITGAVWAAGFATYTTAVPHGLLLGQSVTVAGVNPSGYNVAGIIVAPFTPTTFTLAIGVNPGLYVSGGSIAPINNLAINITNTASIFRSSQLETATGSNFGTVISCANATNPEWNGIRHLASAGTYRLTGTVSDFQDVSTTADITVGSNAQISNITFNTLRFIAATTRVQVTNASGLFTDFTTRPPNLILSDFVTNQVVSDSLIPGDNAQITNFTIQVGANITSTNLTSGSWNNVFLPGNWDLTTTNNTLFVTAMSTIRVVGNCRFFPGAAAGGTGAFLIKNLSCVDFAIGTGGIAGSGGCLICGLVASGNAIIDNNRNNQVVRMQDFRIAGNMTTITMAGEGGYSNGFIGGNLVNNSGQGIRQMYDNIEVAGDVIIGTANCNFQNITCLGPGRIFNITSGNTVVTGLNTRRVSSAAAAGGLLTISGSNNVLTNVNLIGSSVLLGVNSQGNTLTNWRIQGGGAAAITGAVWAAGFATYTTAVPHGLLLGQSVTVVGVTPSGYNVTGIIVAPFTPTTFTLAIGVNPGPYVSGGSIAGPQTFIVNGLSHKLSNIMLGCPVNLNTDDFTINGFGSAVDGAFTVNLGDPASANSRGLQVDNFSVYPKRGQTIAAGVGDIIGAIAAAANRIINISTVGGMFTNCHFWFYPGGLSTSGAALIGHVAPTTNVNVTGFTSQSQFQSLIIGFGGETPGATAATSIGNLVAVGAGNSNSFQSCTAVVYTNAHANAQFNNCNGFGFATLGSPANFTTTGANTIINQCNFGILNIQAANAKVMNSVVTSAFLNAASTGAVVSRNRFTAGFTIAPAPPAPLPLVVGNVGSGAAPANSNLASTGNY